MIVSKYFVGGGLWRLLNIDFNDSLNMGPYMALIVPSSFYRIDAGLHALSFPPGFNVHKLYLK
jgi:hypothetical protein